jgi:lipopolysaccharide transport system ATP-binding protein
MILTDHLSKQYALYGKRSSYKTLRETLVETVKTPIRRLSSLFHKEQNAVDHAPDTMWALNDLSVQIQPGEVVGIIGRNGAGKSTFLKVISQITDPTSGTVDVYGRVGSLLEVGTGFHPELSGRENLYLSGAILGMKRREIDRKLDEIVAFAEIEKFIDTPVKHYSSGMYLRLAFSVAAHLEPDILLVDEVLAVGDIAFQQKCLNHMRKLTQSGMTILLVSHNMAAIQSSCERALWLQDGKLAADGDPIRVIESYRAHIQHANNTGEQVITSEAEGGSEFVNITGFELFGEDGKPSRDIRFGEAVSFQIDLETHQRIDHPMVNFGLLRGDGTPVCNFNNWYDNFKIEYLDGRSSLRGWLPPLRLIPDFYEIHVLVWPWGGGHLQGDLTRVYPYAWKTFGSLSIHGIGLNAHDGVFQVPARKWVFQQNGSAVEFSNISDQSIALAMEEPPQ